MDIKIQREGIGATAFIDGDEIVRLSPTRRGDRARPYSVIHPGGLYQNFGSEDAARAEFHRRLGYEVARRAIDNDIPF